MICVRLWASNLIFTHEFLACIILLKLKVELNLIRFIFHSIVKENLGVTWFRKYQQIKYNLYYLNQISLLYLKLKICFVLKSVDRVTKKLFQTENRFSLKFALNGHKIQILKWNSILKVEYICNITICFLFGIFQIH